MECSVDAASRQAEACSRAGAGSARETELMIRQDSIPGRKERDQRPRPPFAPRHASRQTPLAGLHSVVFAFIKKVVMATFTARLRGGTLYGRWSLANPTKCIRPALNVGDPLNRNTLRFLGGDCRLFDSRGLIGHLSSAKWDLTVGTLYWRYKLARRTSGIHDSVNFRTCLE